MTQDTRSNEQIASDAYMEWCRLPAGSGPQSHHIVAALAAAGRLIKDARTHEHEFEDCCVICGVTWNDAHGD